MVKAGAVCRVIRCAAFVSLHKSLVTRVSPHERIDQPSMTGICKELINQRKGITRINISMFAVGPHTRYQKSRTDRQTTKKESKEGDARGADRKVKKGKDIGGTRRVVYIYSM